MENPETSKVTSIKCPNCGAAVPANTPVCAWCGSRFVYSRVCNACFSVVSTNTDHCPKCGAEVMKSRRVAQKKLKCPACESALETRDDDDHPFHTCPQCGGLWLDHENFQLICERVEKQTLSEGYKLPESNALKTVNSRRAYIPCPECGKIMTPKNFAGCSGVVIDCCRLHGNWFDRQELHQIVEFIRNGGIGKAVKFAINRAREEARREQSNVKFGSALMRYLSDPKIKAPPNA